MKVTSLSEYKDSKSPHINGEAKCMSCQHEWSAIVPQGVFEFQCPNCKLMKGAFNKSIDPNEDIFSCNCGCEVWFIAKSGLFCANCANKVNYSELC